MVNRRYKSYNNGYFSGFVSLNVFLCSNICKRPDFLRWLWRLPLNIEAYETVFLRTETKKTWSIYSLISLQLNHLPHMEMGPHFPCFELLKQQMHFLWPLKYIVSLSCRRVVILPTVSLNIWVTFLNSTCIIASFFLPRVCHEFPAQALLVS